MRSITRFWRLLEGLWAPRRGLAQSLLSAVHARGGERRWVCPAPALAGRTGSRLLEAGLLEAFTQDASHTDPQAVDTVAQFVVSSEPDEAAVNGTAFVSGFKAFPTMRQADEGALCRVELDCFRHIDVRAAPQP